MIGSAIHWSHWFWVWLVHLLIYALLSWFCFKSPKPQALGPPTTGPSPMSAPWVTCPHDSLMQQANALIYWINVALIHCLIYALMQCLWPIGSLGHIIVASDTWAHGFLEWSVDNTIDSYLLLASSNASDSSVRWFMSDCFNDSLVLTLLCIGPSYHWTNDSCSIVSLGNWRNHASMRWARDIRCTDSMIHCIDTLVHELIAWLMKNRCLNVSVFRDHWFVASPMHGAWFY